MVDRSATLGLRAVNARELLGVEDNTKIGGPSRLRDPDRGKYAAPQAPPVKMMAPHAPLIENGQQLCPDERK